MKHYSKPFLIALAGVALITPAQAETFTNTYVRGSIGLNALNDADNTGATGLSIESAYKNGFTFGGAVGANVQDNICVEAALDYRKNKADSLTITNAGGLTGLTTDASGNVTSVSVMGNAYYDVDMSGEIQPYVTGGIGLARLDADISSNGVDIVDDSDTVFAYQIGAGFGYGINENSTLDIGYRYFGTADPTLTDAGGDSFDSEYNAHTVMAGVRYKF
jgi:opacity protein-like surface antigen